MLIGVDSPSILDPKSDAASSIAELWWVMLVIATLVFAVVTALVLLAILRRRGGAGDRLARRLGDNRLLAIGGVAIPLLILAGVFVLSLSTLRDTAPADASEEQGLRIEVTARQWFWDVTYPAGEIVTANEIHVPVGEPVTISVESADVIHSFWVPELNRKIDAIPGRDNELSFTAAEPGRYRGLCAEFCGLQHANMGFYVVAEPAAEFESWLGSQAEPAEPPTEAEARLGKQVFDRVGCASCHRIAGTSAEGEVGPDLTHLASRETIASATLPNDREHLREWVLDPQHTKPGAKMPATPIAGAEIEPLLDYLQGLE